MYLLIPRKSRGTLVKKACPPGDTDVGKLNHTELMSKNSNVACCINNKKRVTILTLEYAYVIGSHKNRQHV